MSFQFNSKNIFLTFPQCQTSLQVFQQKINDFFKENLEKGVICQEDHKDQEGQHLHAAICLKMPVRSRDPRVFDALVDPAKHPNIMGKFTGGAFKAFKYVMKDGNYLPLGSGFDLEAFMEAASQKKCTKTSLILKDIQAGQSLDSLVDDHSEFLLMNLRKVKEYLEFISLRERRMKFAEAQIQKVLVQPAENYFSSSNLAIASWLKLNLREKRPHRTKQLWICAGPGMGKTSLILMLEEAFKLSVYYWPKEEVWWDGYSDGAYDLIVLDEFYSQKTITQLNPILSGDPTPLSRRCSAPLVKRDNLPVIILSNYMPEDCYAKVAQNQPHKLAPLLDRLTIVQTDLPIRLVPIPPTSQAEMPPSTAPPLSFPPLSGSDTEEIEFPGIFEEEEGMNDSEDLEMLLLEEEFARNNDFNYMSKGRSIRPESPVQRVERAVCLLDRRVNLHGQVRGQTYLDPLPRDL